MNVLMFPILLVTALLYPLSLTFIYDALFERRLKKSIHRICLFVAVLLLFTSLAMIPPGTSLLRLASYFIINFFVLCLFRGKLLVRICISVLFYLIATAFETILLPTVLLVCGVTVSQIWQTPIVAFIIYVFPMAMLSVFSLYISKIFSRWKNQIELPALQWLAIFLFSVSTLFELYFASVLINTNSSFMPLLPILGVVLALMNVGLLLLLDKLAFHHKMEQENLSLQEQMRYNRLSMQAATESYEVQRSLTHDFDNHLLTISQLLQNEKHHEALAYTQTVMGSVSKADVAVSTNNPIADAVLNQKYRKSQELGVQVQFLVSDLSNFPLSTDEMVTVLANLLDNALEACVKDSSAQKKSVRVKLLMEPALATLSVQNTSLPVVVSQEGEIATTKEKSSEHGYGLKTCKKILERAGFDFAVQYKDGWFQFTAIKAL